MIFMEDTQLFSMNTQKSGPPSAMQSQRNFALFSLQRLAGNPAVSSSRDFHIVSRPQEDPDRGEGAGEVETGLSMRSSENKKAESCLFSIALDWMGL